MYETENHIILCPNFKMLTPKVVGEILDVINTQLDEKTVAIDMANVCSISTAFLDMINSTPKKIALLNTSAEILVLLNLTDSDKYVRLFTNIIDLEEDKRELRNRKFAIV